MVTATVLVIIFAPLFFVLIVTFLGKGRKGHLAASGGASPFSTAMKERLSGIKERLLKKRGSRQATVIDDGTPSEDR